MHSSFNCQISIIYLSWVGYKQLHDVWVILTLANHAIPEMWGEVRCHHIIWNPCPFCRLRMHKVRPSTTSNSSRNSSLLASTRASIYYTLQFGPSSHLCFWELRPPCQWWCEACLPRPCAGDLASAWCWPPCPTSMVGRTTSAIQTYWFRI